MSSGSIVISADIRTACPCVRPSHSFWHSISSISSNLTQTTLWTRGWSWFLLERWNILVNSVYHKHPEGKSWAFLFGVIVDLHLPLPFPTKIRGGKKSTNWNQWSVPWVTVVTDSWQLSVLRQRQCQIWNSTGRDKTWVMLYVVFTLRKAEQIREGHEQKGEVSRWIQAAGSLDFETSWWSSYWSP